MAYRIGIVEARHRLEAKGYHVEFTDGNAAIYVRKTPSSYPTRLPVPISERSVEILERKAGK